MNSSELQNPQSSSSDTLISRRELLVGPGVAAKGCLVRIHPALLGEGLFELPPVRYVIGRERDCHLPLADDPAVSRQHAYIEPREGRHVIADMGSTNGTYVNDEVVEERILTTGDLIRVGGNILKFLCNDIETQYHLTIYNMMITDGLTGVHSKRFFNDALERELVRSHRHRRPLSLVVFDIDHFKQVNDTHTHLVGDEVLRELCHRIAPAIRKDEVFARWGGEEFAILLPEATLEQAYAFGERIRKLVADNPVPIGAMALPITISVGIGATQGEREMSAHDLFHHADTNLFRAKAAGRNRVIC